MTWMSVFGGMIGALLLRFLGYAFEQLAHVAMVDEDNNAREWFARATARARGHRLPAFRKGMTVVYDPSKNPIASVELAHPSFAGSLSPAEHGQLPPTICVVVCAHAMIGCDDPQGPSCNCQVYTLQEVGSPMDFRLHSIPERAISVSVKVGRPSRL